MRIALIADTHLSVRAPECVANWHAARRAVARMDASLSIHLGDITLDGQHDSEELAFAARLLRYWPTPLRCVPGNHDLGDGSGEAPLSAHCIAAYGEHFGPSCWAVRTGGWLLLGIDAQLLGSDSPEEEDQWAWIEHQALLQGPQLQTALFLHRPLLCSSASGVARRGRHVNLGATQRLLGGALQDSLRLVVSGHMHQFRDLMIDGVRHLWMPSTAFVMPDEMQLRQGEKVVGVGLLELKDNEVRFDLWCPNGMVRHEVDNLQFFRARSSTRQTLAAMSG
jgi:predicted phosphodiesterase